MASLTNSTEHTKFKQKSRGKANSNNFFKNGCKYYIGVDLR